MCAVHSLALDTYHLQVTDSGIIESIRLEKTLKIITSNRLPNTNTTKPCS